MILIIKKEYKCKNLIKMLSIEQMSILFIKIMNYSKQIKLEIVFN